MGAWLRGAVGYEIYVRSFMDSDGDGVGDLGGIRQRLGYLADLGIDLIWLTPIAPSPDADHGYDVADFLSIDPRFGDLDDFDGLVADAHAHGLRLVMDLVPNHSSDQHPWFQDALRGPHAAHRDWYVWRDPAPDGGPPNNWVGHFGGSAWTLDPASGQYYLHLFLPEQPDLNWRNPAVRSEFERILGFWLDRGVDGFRIDVAHALIADAEFRDNPVIGAPPTPDLHPQEAFKRFDHVHDLDQPEVVDVYRSWRPIADAHEAVLIGEVYLTDARRWGRYLDGTGLHSAFWFPTLHTGWDAGELRRALVDGLDRGAAGTSWPMSSHDDPYATARFGGGDLGRQRSLAYLELLCALPGAVFFQQGEELGLDSATFDPGEVADPLATRNEGATGRDVSRAPIPWEPGPSFGFTTGRPWLPMGRNRTDRDTVRVQQEDPDSHLNRVRAVLDRRRSWGSLPDRVEWLDAGPDVIAFRRGPLVAAMNLGPSGAAVPTAVTGRSLPLHVAADATVVTLDTP